MNINGRKNISEFCPCELSFFDDTANDPNKSEVHITAVLIFE